METDPRRDVGDDPLAEGAPEEDEPPESELDAELDVLEDEES
jgi:hypothetical protein